MALLKIGSICAGIGGFDLAFHQVGYETAWYSEIDPQCCKLLAEKFPNAKSYGDLTQFKPNPIADAVDAVCGGTPCQDLSVAGLRAGLDGKRSGLFYQMVRVCKRLRPRHIVWENVPGAFSSNGGRDFAAVLRAFTGLAVEVPAEGWGNAGFVRTPFPACRWHVAWRVLDAQYFGLAQRRERVFLVGSLGDASCLEILFEPESVRGDSAPSREAGQRTTGTISARTEGGGGLGTDFEIGGGLSKTLKAAGNCKHREDSETYVPVTSNCLNARGGIGRIDGESETFIAGALPAMDTPNGHGHKGFACNQSVDANHLVTHTLRGEGFDASEDGTGRGTPIVTVPTLCGGSPDNVKAHGKPSERAAPIIPVAFNIHSQNSCAMKGAGPAKAALQTTVARALDSQGFTASQGGTLVSGPSAVAFQPRYYTRDNKTGGQASEVSPPVLSAESRSRGDAITAVAFTERTRADGRNFECQEEVAYALTNPGSGGRTHSRQIAHESGVRRLTPTECERLQGFPDGWTKGFSDSARYRMLGNAVAEPVARWIAERIKANA